MLGPDISGPQAGISAPGRIFPVPDRIYPVQAGISAPGPDISGVSRSGEILKGARGPFFLEAVHIPLALPCSSLSLPRTRASLIISPGRPASDSCASWTDLHPLGVGIDPVHVISAMDSGKVL